jgi:DNA-binding MarR family transcriptional regulator
MSELELPKFIPFRLNRLAAEVSTKLAEVYTDRFGIDIVEWRILVTLAAEGPCSAQSIVRSTRTHKSRISRGVNRMIELNLVVRSDSRDDRREARLRLSAKGRALHGRMVPVVLAQEQSIVSCLTRQELISFTRAMDKLEEALNLV